MLGALANLKKKGVVFGRAGRAGCAGCAALGWAWGWASAVTVFSSSNAINKQTTQNTELKGKERPIMNSSPFHTRHKKDNILREGGTKSIKRLL